MKKLKILSVSLLVCITIISCSFPVYAGNSFSSVSYKTSKEIIVLNNPINVEWIQNAKSIADDLDTNPFAYFENYELNLIIKKMSDTMHAHIKNCDYDYDTLFKIYKILSTHQ